MKYIRKHIYLITLILFLVLATLIFIKKIELNRESNDIELYEPISEEIPISESIDNYCHVDIKGAVFKEGVYTLECNKHVSDVISLAGGLTEEGDTSVINLAKKVFDEMVIIIYTKEEVNHAKEKENIAKIIDCECICPQIADDACVNQEDNSKSNNSLININIATLSELKTLPGIGESKAKSIIEYRSQHGNFKTIEDIQNVNGIGQKIYEQIKDYITT